jgi:hypothetical protein
MTSIVKSIAALALLSGFVSAASAITPTDAANILFIKQEEKLARDVYQAMYSKWGHTTFKNIAVSEQQHMDAMDGLIARYGLTDTTPAEQGKFTYPELQALYDELIASGSQTLEQALQAGVLIELTDIADIQEALDATKELPIRRVLTNLQNASRNHLSAFNTALSQL